MNSLEIKDLEIRYGAHRAVKSLNLTLDEGTVCALIGPNGAGKTSTLRAIAGLQKIQSGSIHINGIDVARDPSLTSRSIAFMPDHFPLYEDLTVYEYLDHFARAYEIPDRKKVIDECLGKVWLEKKAGELCRSLSRGMKQRLFIGKSLLHDPQVILLDEPASGVDPMGRIELKKIFLELRERKKCLVISSHILTELQDFCNYFFILESGSVVKEGSLDGIASSTIHDRKKFFLRSLTTSLEKLRALLDPAGEGRTEVSNLDRGYLLSFDTDLPNVGGKALETLLRAGVEILEWKDLTLNLEHIYMDSHAKALS